MSIGLSFAAAELECSLTSYVAIFIARVFPNVVDFEWDL